MRPIPKRLLINKIKYYEIEPESRYEGTFKDPITINNVLINYTKTVAKSPPANQEKQTKGTIYLDAVNTKPFLELKYGSKIITDDGQQYFVNAVTPVQSFVLHHYEVTLM